MVVGGAPLWSHDHADQIATMALDLLHQSGKFWIRHLPYTPLRLRIGLHTGNEQTRVLSPPCLSNNYLRYMMKEHDIDVFTH